MLTLIVDDNIGSRTVVLKIMEKISDCEEADSGQQAIVKFEEFLTGKNPFDLIMLDIMMPEIDGLKVLQLIREIEKKNEISKDARVKILMVTSLSQKEHVLTAMKAGCDDYMVKPIKKEILESNLKELKLIE